MSSEPLYLDARGEPVLAFLHPAAGATAVLVVPPFGWEDVCSYRARREWADELAARGHPTLRIDLPGTADSGGDTEEPGRLDAWVAAVAAAAAWLRADGASRTVAIGIGLGGILAWLAAAEGAPLDDLVLWAAPARGRTLVRELRAFARLKASSIVADGDVDPEPELAPEGGLAAGGFLLTAETIAALEGVDLTARPLPDARERRVLLLERDGIPPDERLVRHLTEAGAAVEVQPGDGFGTMMADPGYARPPRDVIARVAAWVGDERVDGGDGPSPALEATAELVHGGTRIRETPVSLPVDGGRLFAVLAEPVEGTRAGLTAVLVNAGAIRRIGPNRMWVAAARRWAARGVPAVRVDLGGIGDSDGSLDPEADDGKFYVPELIGQLRTALDGLEARGLPPRFVLVGLCSGSYWAFRAAVEDDRVAAALMLNPRVLVWSPLLLSERATRPMRRKLLRAYSWRKLVSGEARSQASKLVAVARQTLAPERVRSVARTRLQRVAGGDALDRALERLHADGKHALLVFADDEPLRDEVEREHRFADGKWPNVDVRLIPGRDHTLRPRPMQEQAHALLDDALQRELDRA